MHRPVFGKLCLPRAAHVLKELRPRLQPSTPNYPGELRAKVLVSAAILCDAVLVARLCQFKGFKKVGVFNVSDFGNKCV